MSNDDEESQEPQDVPTVPRARLLEDGDDKTMPRIMVARPGSAAGTPALPLNWRDDVTAAPQTIARSPPVLPFSARDLPEPPAPSRISVAPEATRAPDVFAPTIPSVPSPDGGEQTVPTLARPLPAPPPVPVLPAHPPGPEGTLRSPPLVPAPPVTGRVLSDRYLLLEQIGGGGMGQVYRGEHIRLGTPVAIKTMHPHLAASPEDRRRFLREARAASLLRHPNVVQVLDCDEDAGLVYLVMELVQGQSLGAWLRALAAPPPISDVVSITRMILDALEAAHAEGIVHRDLKPDNVLLTEIGGQRVAKVTDFGLAHVDDPLDAGPTLTQRDMIAGTPEYMSPEQCRSLQVGPSADLYALGCVLTALLQGQPPFPSSGGSTVEIFTKHLFSIPPPLDRPPGAEPVPPLLERLRLDLLAKHPDRRPASAAEAAARLLEALSPDAEAARLPARKAAGAGGTREERAPEWTDADPAPAPAAEPGEARVALLRLAPGAGAVDDACATGLEAQGLRIAKAADAAGVADAGCAVVIVDAGADVEGACALLRALASAAPRTRAVVCASGLGADRMTALVAAGAADAVRAPVTADVLGRKLWRVIRRGR